MQTLKDRYPTGKLNDLRYIDLPIVYEEVDVIDEELCERVFPTLSGWKHLYRDVSAYRWCDIRRDSPFAEMQCHISRSKMMLGESPPHLHMFSQSVHIVFGNDRLTIVMTREIADEGLFMHIRDREMSRRPKDTYWLPSGIRWPNKVCEHDMIVANRIVVMASPPKCVDRLATMIKLAL